MDEHDFKEIWIDEMGIVKVVKVHPTGATVVKDCNGRRWLLPAWVIDTQESTLWSGM